jgi:hypothetical protein
MCSHVLLSQGQKRHRSTLKNSQHTCTLYVNTHAHTRTFDRPHRATKKQQDIGCCTCCNDKSTSDCRAEVFLRCWTCPCWERAMCAETSPNCRNRATPSFRVCSETAPRHKDSTASSVCTTLRGALPNWPSPCATLRAESKRHACSIKEIRHGWG